MSTLQERLASLRGDMKDAEFSRKTGIPSPTLKRYEEGSSPSIAIATKIADAFSVSLDWLSGRIDEPALTNVMQLRDVASAPSNSPQSAVERDAVIGDDESDSEMVAIPAYEEVRPAAGPGTVAINQQPTSIIAFDRRWLRDLGVNPSYAKILFAEGDSMYPTIPNGSPMLVDASKIEVRHGCIYVFDLDGDLMVKRIERLPDGTIDLISDNRERYPTRNITRDRLEQMHVIGRVFSAVRTF